MVMKTTTSLNTSCLGEKKGTTNILQDKNIKNVKKCVQQAVRELELHKLHSGCGVLDVNNKNIYEKY